MAESKNRGSGASLFGGEWLDSSSSHRNSNGGGGATLFSDFSAFREMIRQEREIAKAEAGANREAARAEIKAAKEDQRRLMEEAF